MSRLRVAFAGTPAFAAEALDAIIHAGHELVLVLTQPDRPAGRGMKLTPSAVKCLAIEHGITVDQPERLRSEEQRAHLTDCAPDVLVVAAYGQLLPPQVLQLPRLGCINIHASLLPRWRGAAPIQRAVQAGDSLTGISIMQMDEGLDTGAVLLAREIAIEPQDTAASLHDRLAALGAALIVEVLAGLDAGRFPASAQSEEGATYAAKISKSEAYIDWSRSAAEIERMVRAFNPFPVAHTRVGDRVLRIWQAQVVAGRYGVPGTVLQADEQGVLVACAQDALQLIGLQKPGGRRLTTAELLQSFPLRSGDCFIAAVDSTPS